MGTEGVRANWEQILRDYLTTSKPLPFIWGKNDCCLWVARYVDIVRGSNISADWHGKYETEEAAQKFMSARGLHTPPAIADAHLTPKPVTHAGRGDIVSFEGGALGICAGRNSYFFVEGRGLSMLPTLKCIKAWKV